MQKLQEFDAQYQSALNTYKQLAATPGKLTEDQRANLKELNEQLCDLKPYHDDMEYVAGAWKDVKVEEGKDHPDFNKTDDLERLMTKIAERSIEDGGIRSRAKIGTK